MSDAGLVELRLSRNWSERSSLALHAADPAAVEVGDGPLWPALLTLVRLGETPPPLEAAALGAMCAAATLAFAVVAATDARGRQAAAWTALVLSTCVPFAVWSTGGTADALAGLLLFLTWYAATSAAQDGPLVGVGLLSFATTLARPDGFFQALVAAAAGGARAGAPWRSIGAALAGLATAVGLRTALYGTPIPWSLWVMWRDADPLGGLGWLSAAVVTCLPIPAAWLLAPWAGSVLRTAVIPVLAVAAVPVFAGGDREPVASALFGALPFLAVIAGAGAARAPVRARWAAAALTLVAALPHVGVGLTAPWAGRAGQSAVNQWHAAIDGVREARSAAIALREVGGGRQSVVASPAGGLGWFSRWQVVDPTGRFSTNAKEEGVRPFASVHPTVLDMRRADDDASLQAAVAEWKGWAAQDPGLHTTWGPRFVSAPQGDWVLLYRWDDTDAALRSWSSPLRASPPGPAGL